MRKAFLILLGIVFLGSCEWYDDIDVIEVGKIKLNQLQGNTAKVNVDVELHNPNFYAITVKPSILDVYVEEEYLGKAHLMQKLKFKRKSTSTYIFEVELLGETGILRKVMKFALKDSLKVRLVGNVKGSVLGISKRIAVDETKTIDGAKFRLGMPSFN